MIEPIRLSFELACPADHAFTVWTERIAQWWPADHDATTQVEIEHRGWEALGSEGECGGTRNHGGWATLLPNFVRLAEADAERPQTGIAGRS